MAIHTAHSAEPVPAGSSTFGDTLVTLPRAVKQLEKHRRLECDVLSIDGGHTLKILTSDLRHMRQLASPRHVAIVDDLHCAANWCREPTEAWRRFKESGALTSTGLGIPGRSHDRRSRLAKTGAATERRSLRLV